MEKFFKKIAILFCLTILLFSPYLVLASTATGKLIEVAEGGAYATYVDSTNGLAAIVGIGIQAFLGLLGVIFLILIIYAGYGWMMARGEEEKVTKAKDTLTRAIIGLIIVIGAYAISYWVIDSLTKNSGILQ